MSTTMPAHTGPDKANAAGCQVGGFSHKLRVSVRLHGIVVALLLLPGFAPRQTPVETVEYYHFDALGSV